ncbi:hypothetical protein KKH05_00815 [Patescibacteria group bacterium]|nr:hypothetical protein [Patescibacteria group bacterium]
MMSNKIFFPLFLLLLLLSIGFIYRVYADISISSVSVIVIDTCGNSSCGVSETCSSCPADCGACVVPPSGGGGGGGGGGSSPADNTKVTLTGRAYPLSQIEVLKDGKIVASTIAGSDSRFSVSIEGFNVGNHIFSIISKDKDGVQSEVLSYPLTVQDGVTINITGIFIAPTLSVDKSEVRKGENISIFGQASPQSSIVIGISSPQEIFANTVADKNGVYLYNYDTAFLGYGGHEARSKAAVNNEISDFGKTVAFKVGDKTVYNTNLGCPARGNLNGDCRVNLIDFSIAVYWYRKPLSTQIKSLEATALNGDGQINLIDLSIMAYYWTG